MQAGGPVKWKDKKEEIPVWKRNWKKDALYFFLSLCITVVVFLVALYFRKIDNNIKIKEIKVFQVNYKDERPRYKFLKSISSYDTIGRIVKTIEFNAMKAKILASFYKYDVQGRLSDSLAVRSASNKDSGTQHIYFMYTGNHLSQKNIDSLYSIKYVYNSSGQTEREEGYRKKPGGGNGYKEYSIHYSYDKKNRLLQADDSLSPENHKTTNYLYDKDGLLFKLQEGNNTTVYLYDGRNELVEEIHKIKDKVLYKLEYHYDYYLRKE